MAAQNDPPESQFAFVVVAARRARQLMAGAPPLIANPKSRQPTRIAEEELRHGQLQYEVPVVGEDGGEGEKRR
jgi:DNA-directed RNA polymerase omega subunit